MTSYQEAYQLVLEEVQDLGHKVVPLENDIEIILAVGIFARCDDRAKKDGIAINFADIVPFCPIKKFMALTHEFVNTSEVGRRATEKGLKAVFATMVALKRSSNGNPWARILLLENNGTMIGATSGGGSEKKVFRQARSVFEKGISSKEKETSLRMHFLPPTRLQVFEQSMTPLLLC